MFLEDYLAQWLERMELHLKPSSYEGYESVLRVHVIKQLGRYRIEDITPELIGSTWAKMNRNGKSAVLINHCHRRLSKALQDAADQKPPLIKYNPCSTKQAKPPTIEEKEINPFDFSEIDKVLTTTKEHYSEYYPIVFMALHTGMRRNELLALKWKDVDLARGVFNVIGNMYRKNGQTIYHGPKTTKGKRLVNLAPEAKDFLTVELQKQLDNGLFFGYQVNKNSHVFIRTEGKATGAYLKDRSGNLIKDSEDNPIPIIESIPFLPNTVSRTFKKICRRLSLDSNKMNDNRHTHATVLFKRGVHPKIVQERLGHSSINVTMDIYSHMLPSMQGEAVKDLVLSPDTADETALHNLYETLTN